MKIRVFVVSDIIKKTLLLAIFVLFFAPCFAKADTYYYTNSFSNDWTSVFNWFSDADFTIPAGTTPGPGDIVYIYASVDTSTKKLI